MATQVEAFVSLVQLSGCSVATSTFARKKCRSGRRARPVISNMIGVWPEALQSGAIVVPEPPHKPRHDHYEH